MTLDDIIKRVQAKLDDIDGTYVTPEYVEAFAQGEYEKLFNKLRLSDHSFDQIIVEIPNVAATTPNLDTYQATGQILSTMVRPRSIEWKLAGQLPTQYREADGPLDQVRDLPAGIPQLDSWAWMRRSIKLSNFSTNLDLRIIGEFLFNPLSDPSSSIDIDITANEVLASMVAAAIAKARGNATWVQQYTADAVDAFDDLFIALVREDQGKTRRVGRMSHINRGINPVIAGR